MHWPVFRQYISNILNQKEPIYQVSLVRTSAVVVEVIPAYFTVESVSEMEDYPEDYNLPDHVTENKSGY